jgi:hypothetical protein
MKKLTIILASAALMAGTSASAGEIAGNGKAVPGGAQGASICSYSGLNDTPWDILGFTQTFAVVMKLFGIMPGDPDHPGQACRGNH